MWLSARQINRKRLQMSWMLWPLRFSSSWQVAINIKWWSRLSPSSNISRQRQIRITVLWGTVGAVLKAQGVSPIVPKVYNNWVTRVSQVQEAMAREARASESSNHSSNHSSKDRVLRIRWQSVWHRAANTEIPHLPTFQVQLASKIITKYSHQRTTIPSRRNNSTIARAVSRRISLRGKISRTHRQGSVWRRKTACSGKTPP